MFRKWMVCLATCGVVVGCNPAVIVKQNPGKHDHGLRFYRPKPYLLITPADKENVKEDHAIEAMKAGLVKIKLEYLPDFGEEYSVRTRVGLGKASSKIVLKDGWNLTNLDSDLDSKFAENVNAIANLLKSAAPSGVIPAPAAAPRTSQYMDATVPAWNVPLGYYEAVIARGPDDQKRLYGWKYVGFMPYAGCPIDAAGSEPWCCKDGESPVYGLVNVKGVMTFMRLPSIALKKEEEEVLVSSLRHGEAHSQAASRQAGEPVHSEPVSTHFAPPPPDVAPEPIPATDRATAVPPPPR